MLFKCIFSFIYYYILSITNAITNVKILMQRNIFKEKNSLFFFILIGCKYYLNCRAKIDKRKT